MRAITPPVTVTNATPLDVLQKVFGFSSFRGLQEEAITTVMDGDDVLLLMPTGGGKSLCYQIPALCRSGMGLVVSPLIALMDDQVVGLQQMGIRAAALHSELDSDARQTLWNRLRGGEIDILYISPERLLTSYMLEFLRHHDISVIAIDEAHCVSAWGHEFRPEYRGLTMLRQNFPSVPRIALTATADDRTRVDILTALKMEEASILTASFHRPNLFLEAQPKNAGTRQLLVALERYKGKGAAIVYCGSRRRTERIAALLNSKGVTALPYHAGLSSLERHAALMRFRSGEALTIVATIAFGMGIDRPDVRTVIHLDMPASPEAYYQQIGRAGRDGEPSYALLLYDGQDIARTRYWLEQSSAPHHEKTIMHQRLDHMVQLTETTECRTKTVLACFGESLSDMCGHCDNCRHPVPIFDGRVAAQKVLSTVYRTGERFGAALLTAVLRGKETEAVQAHALQHLSVFGIGQEQSEQWWRMVIRQLIARGVLRLTTHKGLGLVRDKARPLLRGEIALPLREDISFKTLVSLDRTAKENDPVLSETEEKRFQTLRAWRFAEAREQEVPPYVIFRDSVLRDIARLHPLNLTVLGQIKGVGEQKTARYGQAVLNVLDKKENRRERRASVLPS